MLKLALAASAAFLFAATTASADGIEPCVSCKDPRPVAKKTVKRAVKPKVVYVARVREVPVYRDREVEKIVEVPVERRVEVPVDRPVYVDRRVEVPVDRPVYIEKRVEVPVDRPVYVDRPVDRPVYIEKRVEVPVERRVEVPVYVDRTRTVVVERPVVERWSRSYEYGQPRVVDQYTSTGHYPDMSGHRYQGGCNCQPTEKSRYSYYEGGSRNLNSDISGHESDIRGRGASYESYESEYESSRSSSSSSYSSYGYGSSYGGSYGQWGYGGVGQYSGINGAGGWRSRSYYDYEPPRGHR